MGSSRLPKYAAQPLRRSPPVPVVDTLALTLPPSVRGLKWPWANSPRLADLMEPSQNSFSLLRLMLALAVLVSHTMFLAVGDHAAEPLVGLTATALANTRCRAFSFCRAFW